MHHFRQQRRVRAGAVANLQSARKRLRKRRKIQSGKLRPRRQAQHAAGRMRRLVIQFAVGRVLDHRHHDALGGQRLGNGIFLSIIETARGRIGEITDKINRLQPRQLAPCPHARQQRAQPRTIDAPGLVQRQRTRLHAQPRKHLQKDEVTRTIHQHDVARITQHLHRQIQRLLRSVGYKKTTLDRIRIRFQLRLLSQQPLGKQAA